MYMIFWNLTHGSIQRDLLNFVLFKFIRPMQTYFQQVVHSIISLKCGSSFRLEQFHSWISSFWDTQPLRTQNVCWCIPLDIMVSFTDIARVEGYNSQSFGSKPIWGQDPIIPDLCVPQSNKCNNCLTWILMVLIVQC